MKFYNIFLERDEKEVKKIIFLYNGFNIFALIFNIFWLIYKKLFLFAFLFFVATYFLFFCVNLYIFLFVYFALSFLIAFYSDRLLMKKYIKNDYKYLGNCFGKNMKDARRIFLEACNEDKKEVDNNIQDGKEDGKEEIEFKD